MIENTYHIVDRVYREVEVGSLDEDQKESEEKFHFR